MHRHGRGHPASLRGFYGGVTPFPFFVSAQCVEAVVAGAAGGGNVVLVEGEVGVVPNAPKVVYVLREGAAVTVLTHRIVVEDATAESLPRGAVVQRFRYGVAPFAVVPAVRRPLAFGVEVFASFTVSRAVAGFA